VQTLLRGGTPTMATRSADFPSLCRKVQAMKKKVHEQKARPIGNASPEESSVGTVAAPSMTSMTAASALAESESREVEEVAVAASSIGMARAV
jgi:hypothetical protein